MFVAYGVGMGLLVGAASLAVALAQESLITRLRRFGGVAARVAGLLLVLVGAYVAYYGWWELRVLAGGPAQTVYPRCGGRAGPAGRDRSRIGRPRSGLLASVCWSWLSDRRRRRASRTVLTLRR